MTVVGRTWTRCLSSTSATSFNPRAQPRDRPIPGPVFVDAARPACAGLGGDLRMGLKPSAMSTTGSGWCCATPCASSSLAARVRCRLGTSSEIAIRHVVLHQPSSHGPGAGWLSPPGASRLESLRSCETQDPLTRASPQPDPPGHLMSRDRGAPGGEPAAYGRRPRRAGTVDLRDPAAWPCSLACALA